MDKYSIPKTIFLHATENEVTNMVQQQKIHNEIMSNVKSIMKRDRENKLHKSVIKLRKQKRANLRKRLKNDLGIPFSLTFQLSQPQQFEILYDTVQHHYRLKKVQNNKKKTDDFKDIAKMRHFAKRSHEHRQKIYTSARERYLGISKAQTMKEMRPCPPSTKKKKSSSKSIRINRTIKQVQKQQKQKELDQLIEQEMRRIMEMKQTKKKAPQRLIQSARKYSNEKHNSFKPNRQIQSARTHRIKKQQNNKKRNLSVLDHLLLNAEKENGEQKFGLTLPMFIRKVTEFMEQQQQKQTEEQKMKESKEKLQSKPKWNDRTNVRYVKKRNIRTLLSSTDMKDLRQTTWLRRKAYGNIVDKRRYRSEEKKIDKQVRKDMVDNKPDMNIKEKVQIPSLPLKDINLS